MPWLKQYSTEIAKWDTTHRLVGRLSPEVLIEQSVEALNDLHPSVVSPTTLFVDVGAGSGLLGIPALNLFPSLKVLFVEPDPKKAAFLRHYLFGVQKELGKRSFVQTQLMQNVSRETLEKLKDLTPVLFARAFSGEHSLQEAVDDSVFAGRQLFVFRSDGPRHFFEKLC